MVNQQLLDYIKGQLGQNVPKEQIKSALLGNGWLQSDVEEAFNIIFPNVPTPITKSNVGVQSSVSYQQSINTTKPFTEPVSQVSQNATVYTKQVMPGAFSVLKESFSILGSRMLVVISIVVVYLALVFANFYSEHYYNLISNNNYSDIFWIVKSFLYFVLSAWIGLALVHAIVFSEERISFVESFVRGGKRLFSYWWLTILSGFAVFGGLILLVVPGIIMSFWLVFAQMVWAKEGIKGSKAIMKSGWYIKGYIGSVISKSIGLLILTFIITLAVGILLAVFGLNENIINSINYAITSPLTLAFVYVMYRHLRSIKGEDYSGPNKKDKVIVWGTAIIGIIALPILAYLFITAFDKAFTGTLNSGFENQLEVSESEYFF